MQTSYSKMWKKPLSQLPPRNSILSGKRGHWWRELFISSNSNIESHKCLDVGRTSPVVSMYLWRKIRQWASFQIQITTIYLQPWATVSISYNENKNKTGINIYFHLLSNSCFLSVMTFNMNREKVERKIKNVIIGHCIWMMGMWMIFFFPFVSQTSYNLKLSL